MKHTNNSWLYGDMLYRYLMTATRPRDSWDAAIISEMQRQAAERQKASGVWENYNPYEHDSEP